MATVGDRANHPLLRTWDEHLAMDAKLLSGMIQNAQRKVEAYYFESRKHVLDYDDVMNRQRELIYRERRRILEGVNLKETILHYVRENIQAAVTVYARADQPQSEWDLDTLYNELNDFFLLFPIITVDDLQGKSREQMIEFLVNHVTNVYESREKSLRRRRAKARCANWSAGWRSARSTRNGWSISRTWSICAEGIHLRGYEQKDRC